MHIVVVGAGRVGASVAESLADTHEVVVVDIDRDRVESLTYDLDVLAIEGDGADLATLREADIEDADILIASTDDDETNLVTCGTAKTVSDAFTIARVRNTKFLDTWEHAEGALGVDHMVGTNLLTARTIVEVIGHPAALDVAAFAGGLVRMAEFEIPECSTIAGGTVAEADRFGSLTFAAVLGDDDVTIPDGDTVIDVGDDVVVIGSAESIKTFAHAVNPNMDDADEVLIVGGGSIGVLTAEQLSEHGYKPTLVERDPDRARAIAEDLPHTTVLQHDGTDVDFLEREHADETDVVVAALESDEKNLLVALLAKRLGTDRTIAVVEDGAYAPLFETVGVDVAVNPREATAEEITRFTRERRAENVALVESDRAEVLEIEVDADSVLVDRPIREAAADLPDGVTIGAIVRDGDLVVPRGETVVHIGDHVVLFVAAEDIERATELL